VGKRAKKDKELRVRIDDDLDQAAREYAEKAGHPLGAIVRAILRDWFNREDPRPLPPGVEQEKERPSARGKRNTPRD
jgi:uncharacterized membrane-anchored protein YjiN (DUF445 family)